MQAFAATDRKVCVIFCSYTLCFIAKTTHTFRFVAGEPRTPSVSLHGSMDFRKKRCKPIGKLPHNPSIAVRTVPPAAIWFQALQNMYPEIHTNIIFNYHLQKEICYGRFCVEEELPIQRVFVEGAQRGFGGCASSEYVNIGLKDFSDIFPDGGVSWRMYFPLLRDFQLQ